MEMMSSISGDSVTPLAAGFADFVGRLAVKLGSSNEAAEVAKEATKECVMALADGHVCIELKYLARATGRNADEIRLLLAGSGVVSPGGDGPRLPLILDDEGRIYLCRYYDYERELAALLAARVNNLWSGSLSAEARVFIDKRFAGNAGRLSGRPDWQKIAVVKAMTSPLAIISGGPGTGKTTIVTTLIAALSMDVPLPRIALAAPTGKAAARMEDSIRRQLDTLDPDIRERLPMRASTIHMLLGARPESDEFRHNRDNPIPYDLVVVDEASMIDLSLAARLFSALPQDAGVVLLGDKDQLAAVEAGAVFGELAGESSVREDAADRILCDEVAPCTSGQQPGDTERTLSGCVVWLRENYRFDADSAIGKMAELVVNGDTGGIDDWLGSRGGEEIKWKSVSDGLPLAVAEELAGGFDPYVEAVKRGDPEESLRACEKFIILCAVRRGRRGVSGINEAMTQRLRFKLSGEVSSLSGWYHGRPIMVTENDYRLGVFNGDIGVAIKGEDGNIGVWFATREGGVRHVSPLSLPAHQTAFAITVHKAQGSEFEKVALVLPESDSPVMTRELVYTAVTRAKQKLFICGSMDILKSAIRRPTVRRIGLSESISLNCKKLQKSKHPALF